MRLGHPLLGLRPHKHQTANEHHARRRVEQVHGHRIPPRQQESARRAARSSTPIETPRSATSWRSETTSSAPAPRRSPSTPASPARDTSPCRTERNRSNPAARCVHDAHASPNPLTASPACAIMIRHFREYRSASAPAGSANRYHRQRQHQPHVPQVDRLARAMINFPPHRHRPHLVAGVREHRTDEKQQIVRLAQRRDGIDFRAFRHGYVCAREVGQSWLRWDSQVYPNRQSPNRRACFSTRETCENSTSSPGNAAPARTSLHVGPSSPQWQRPQPNLNQHTSRATPVRRLRGSSRPKTFARRLRCALGRNARTAVVLVVPGLGTSSGRPTRAIAHAADERKLAAACQIGLPAVRAHQGAEWPKPHARPPPLPHRPPRPHLRHHSVEGLQEAEDARLNLTVSVLQHAVQT